jgi:peptidoglycan/LPS O-acetylase OafA/YrhL
MQWPGLLTVPVVLATAVILMNKSSREANKLLENKVMLYLGDISYLLYLWHWPIFIIIKGVSGSSRKVLHWAADICLIGHNSSLL